MTMATIETEIGKMTIYLDKGKLIARRGKTKEILEGENYTATTAIRAIRAWYSLPTWGLVEMAVMLEVTR